MFITRRPSLCFAPDEGAGAGADVQAQTPETADTPEGTGTGQQTESQTNWEERYREAQAWGTRTAQEAAELRAYKQLVDDWNSDDPEAQKRAAERLGIQLEEDDDDDTLYESQATQAQLSPEDRQLLEQFRAQQQTQAEQQQYQAYRSDVDPQLQQMGVPEGLRDAVAEAALNLPGIQTPQGLRPDLEGAVKQIQQFALIAAELPDVQKQILESYRQTKRAPGVSSAGTAGTQVPDLDDRQARIDWMVEQAMAQQD